MTSSNAVQFFPGTLRRAGAGHLRALLRISLWARWFVVIAWLAQLHHHVEFGHPAYLAHALFSGLLLAVSAFVLYRSEMKRMVSWRWPLALGAMDLALLAGGLAIATSIENSFFVLYYVALAAFAAVSISFGVTVAAATVVAAVHLALGLASEPVAGLGTVMEGYLLTQVIAMYAVTAAVAAVSRFERSRSLFDRTRRKEAVERERELQQERIELSQGIHNTIAQSVYLIGLGLETAIELEKDQARGNRDELRGKLEATLNLSKSTMWELRHPIDAGAIFEGRELGRVLRSHAATFSTITSIPTEMHQSGREPPLPMATRRRLFSIAHNALTNALRHSQANRIILRLDFGESIRLSVSDDGVGLPDDYRDRGHGFRNMRMDAERLGGALETERDESGRGTTITCVIPYALD